MFKAERILRQINKIFKKNNDLLVSLRRLPGLVDVSLWMEGFGLADVPIVMLEGGSRVQIQSIGANDTS